jgi:hypothetical protein
MKIKLSIILSAALVSGVAAVLIWRLYPTRTPGASKTSGDSFNGLTVSSDPAPSPLLHLMNQPHLVEVRSDPAAIAPPVAPHRSPSSVSVEIILDPNAAFEARLEALDELGSHLSEPDWKKLKDFLLQPDPLDKGQLNQVIKNRLMDVLCAMDPALPDLGEALREIYQDAQQNEVIRDYAVQHLATYYQLADGQITPTEEQNIRQTLWEALAETQTSIAGTALLALNRLSGEFPGFDQSLLATQAVSLAADSTAGELTHVSALQVCARMSLANALPVAVQAANSGETVAVKMSAINVIGQDGGAQQIALLKQFLTMNDGRLQMVAQTALQKIESRLARQPGGR